VIWRLKSNGLYDEVVSIGTKVNTCVLLLFFLVSQQRCEMKLFGCYGNNDCFCFHDNYGHYFNFHCYQFRSWHLTLKLVIWKYLWPKENLIWNMHLLCKMFYFCFHGNHSHNSRLKVYLIVSFVISNVKKLISVNTF
jgi:hypothetical protein